MSSFSEDKLPKSFLNEIVSVSSNLITLRSSIKNLEDCNKWVNEFGKLTNTKWNTRSSKPSGIKMICLKKYVCHHSAFMKIPTAENKRKISKNSSCLATLSIKVKVNTARTRKADPFVKKGLLGIIKINDIHNHSLTTDEILKFLPSSDYLEEFKEYFNDGMGAAAALRCHEKKIQQEDKHKDGKTPNSKISPSYRTVQYWYDKFHIQKLGSRSSQRLKQKELAAQREAGLISDDAPEVSGVESLESVPQTSNAQTDPVPGTSQHATSTELVKSETQNNNGSQVPLVCVAVKDNSSIVESSSTSTSQINLNNSISLVQASAVDKDNYILPDVNVSVVNSTQTKLNSDRFRPILPLITNADTSTSSNILKDIKSSQITETSATVVVSSSTTEAVKNSQSFTPLLTYSAKTYSSTVTKNITSSSQVDLPSATAKSSSITQTVLNNDPFTLPLVPTTETHTLSDFHLPVSSSTATSYKTRRAVTSTKPPVSNTKSPILPVVSIPLKDIVQTQKLPKTQKSVATQINFNELEFIKTGKVIYPSKKLTGTNPLSAKPLPKEATIKGRRIIDFMYFFKKLKSVNKHSKFGCNLNNMYITKEKKVGIGSSYVLKCLICDYETLIKTELSCQHVNRDFVSAMLSINCSFDTMNKLLTKMCLPNLTQAEFAKARNQLSSGIKDSEKAYCASSKKVRKPQEISLQQDISSTSEDDSNLLEQIELDGLLVEDQFEIKEEVAAENESEDILPNQTKIADEKSISDKEDITLNMAIVKQEINSDDEENTCTMTSKIQISNEESLTKNNQSMFESSQPKEAEPCKNMKVNEGQISDMITIKAEIRSDPDTEQQTISLISEAQMPNKEPFTESNDQSKELVTNLGEINLSKNTTTKHIKDNNRLVQSESSGMKIKGKGSTSDVFNQPEIKLPATKGSVATLKGNKEADFNSERLNKFKFSDKDENTNKKKIKLDEQAKSGSIIDSLDRFVKNVAPSSTTATVGENVTASSSIASPMGNVYFISVPTSNGNGTLIVPQVSQNIASGTFQGIQGTTLIPQASTVVQQNSGESNRGLLPLASMQQPWANNLTPTISNPIILIPGVGGTTYMPGLPGLVASNPTSTSSSNVPINASGITYMPIAAPPSTSQQASNSSNIRLPLNAGNPRWIGPANMNNNDPFCKLPGGAPKGVSDAASPKSNSEQGANQSKQPQFRCDDCDINFPKYESLDSHKKLYCIKRLKLPPSSTVTSQTINNPLQPISLTSSVKPYIDELLSAMTIKRSFLETSMKTALDAQYIINLHKSAQDLTKQSFKELDDALKREKYLMPEASLEEQQFVSEARAKALIRAEAAYKQEKYSAAAVEQALNRQKAAIEASVTATDHEQTALVATLKSLKEQANQGNKSAMSPSLNNNLFDEKIFYQDASLIQNLKQQQVAHSSSSESISDHKASSSTAAFFMERRNEARANSNSPVVQNVMHFDVHSTKPSTINLEENKTVVLNILPNNTLHLKEIDKTSSCSNSNASAFLNSQPRFSPDSFYSQRTNYSNVATLVKTSTTPEYKNQTTSLNCFHSQEMRDERVSSIGTQDDDKNFIPFDQVDEMMDISAPSSTANIQTLIDSIPL